MIVIDGNDGTGKSTLVERLRKLGLRVSDRGLPSKLTIDEPNLPAPSPHDRYLILEAPIEVSRARLEAAGKDLNEKWHTVESLRHFQVKFREVGAQLGATFIDSNGTPEETWAKVRHVLDILDRSPHIGVPKGRLKEAAFNYVDSEMPEPALLRQMLGDRLLTYRGTLGKYTLLKAKSIPDMITLRLLDIGITGEDLIKESLWDEDVISFHPIHGSAVNISVLAPVDWELENQKYRSMPLMIATEYPNLASRWASQKGLSHIIVRTHGSTEAFVPVFCDIAIDVVETGETAAVNGLKVVETLAISRPVVAFRKGSGMAHHKLVPEGLNT